MKMFVVAFSLTVASVAMAQTGTVSGSGTGTNSASGAGQPMTQPQVNQPESQQTGQPGAIQQQNRPMQNNQPGIGMPGNRQSQQLPGPAATPTTSPTPVRR